MSVDVTYQDGMQEFDFTLNIGFQVLIMLLWETMGTGDNCWVCALTRNPSCCGESEAEVSTCDASWGVDVQKVFLEPCEDAMTIPNHAIGVPVHDIGSIMINVCAAEFFTTFYVLCCLFSLFCLVVFFGMVCVFCLLRVAVCHIHSFGRPAHKWWHLDPSLHAGPQPVSAPLAVTVSFLFVWHLKISYRNCCLDGTACSLTRLVSVLTSLVFAYLVFADVQCLLKFLFWPPSKGYSVKPTFSFVDWWAICEGLGYQAAANEKNPPASQNVLQGPLYYQPKQCTIFGGNPSKSPYICIVWSPPNIGNLMTLKFFEIAKWSVCFVKTIWSVTLSLTQGYTIALNALNLER